MENNYLVVIGISILIVLFLWLFVFNHSKDSFKATGSSCKIDENCPPGEFCYMGQCWGYWKDVNMPWSTCRNPYCGSTEPTASCGKSQGKCLPYCKCQLNRQLGGSLSLDCFPKCGHPCLNNDQCPPGCPQCKHGVCSSPEPGNIVL